MGNDRLNVSYSKIAISAAIWTIPFSIPGTLFAVKDGIDSNKAIGLLAAAVALFLIFSLLMCWGKRQSNAAETDHQAQTHSQGGAK